MKVPGKVVGVIVLAALVLVIVPRALGWRSDRDRWEARADSAVTRAERAEAWVDTLDARIDSLTQAVGDSVVVLVKRDTVIRVRVDSVRALPVPDTCAPFVAVRDSLLDEALASAESWKRAYGQQVLIAGLLKASRDTLRVSLDSALAVLRKRPKPPSLLGLGATCGLGLRGYDCAIGVTVRVDPVSLDSEDTMNRREWVKYLTAAGLIAPMEPWRRRFFPGFGPGLRYWRPFQITGDFHGGVPDWVSVYRNGMEVFQAPIRWSLLEQANGEWSHGEADLLLPNGTDPNEYRTIITVGDSRFKTLESRVLLTCDASNIRYKWKQYFTKPSADKPIIDWT